MAVGALASPEAWSSASEGKGSPKPEISLSISGAKGRVPIRLLRCPGCYATTLVHIGNATTRTLKGLRLHVYLRGGKLLRSKFEGTPFPETSVKKTRVGGHLTFALPPMTPETEVDLVLFTDWQKVKPGRICPGYAIASAPGSVTQKRAFPCFTVS